MWPKKFCSMQNSLYVCCGKRLFDSIAALIAILLLSPVFLICAVLVNLSGPGGVVFKHVRVGRNFTRFAVYKFRTMSANSPKNLAITVGGDSRITAVGRFLRKTKLDELPQLFNVLFGEMSIVGPRPEVEKYVNLFRQDYQEILSVRPGISDYAAIEFRDEESILAKYADPEMAYVKEILPAKISLYKKYISDQSMACDLGIIFRTFAAIFR